MCSSWEVWRWIFAQKLSVSYVLGTSQHGLRSSVIPAFWISLFQQTIQLHYLIRRILNLLSYSNIKRHNKVATAVCVECILKCNDAKHLTCIRMTTFPWKTAALSAAPSSPIHILPVTWHMEFLWPRNWKALFFRSKSNSAKYCLGQTIVQRMYLLE